MDKNNVNNVYELIDNILNNFFNNITSKKKKYFISSISKKNKINDSFSNEFINVMNEILNDFLINNINLDIPKTFIINEECNDFIKLLLIKCVLTYYIIIIGCDIDENYLSKYYEIISNFITKQVNISAYEISQSKKHIDFIKKLKIHMLNPKIKNNSEKENDKLLNEFINENKNLDIILKDNQYLFFHEIIKKKIPLIFEEYIKNYNLMIEKNNESNNDFIYIDVVLPLFKENISLNDIIILLNNEEINASDDIYEYIINRNKISANNNINLNISSLLNGNIIVPIVEDFLLYHKNNEKYIFDKVTKLKYINDKIDNVSNLYSSQEKNNKNKNIEFEKNLNTQGISINHFENISILNKYINLKIDQRSSIYNNIIEFTQNIIYPYVNFKTINDDHFIFHNNKNIDIIRLSSLNANNIHKRVSGLDNELNIVGFAINISPKTHSNFIKNKNKITKLINIKDYNIDKKKAVENYKDDNNLENAIEFIKKKLNLYLFNKKKYNKIKKNKKETPFWKFNIKTDISKKNIAYVNDDNKISNEVLYNVVSFYYELIDIIYNLILKKLSLHKKISIDGYFHLIEFIENKIINIKLPDEYLEELKYIIFYKKNNIDKSKLKKSIIISKKKTSKTKTSETKSSKTKTSKKKSSKTKTSKKKSSKTKSETTDNKYNNDNKNEIKNDILCCHEYYLKYVLPNDDNRNSFNDFVDKYCFQNENNITICKSCGNFIEIGIFVTEGKYTDDGGYIEDGSIMKLKLEDMFQYEKYGKIIIYLEGIFKNIYESINIKYYLNFSPEIQDVNTTVLIKERRKELIQKLIDIITDEKLFEGNQERNINRYGINPNISDLNLFKLNKNIFEENSEDNFLIRNSIIAYIVSILIIEINEYQISYMTENKMCNKQIYNTYGYKFFNDIKIINNNSNDIVLILNYPMLCYLIFNMACNIYNNKIWNKKKNEIEKKTQDILYTTKKIIYTIVDSFNQILELCNSNNGYNYNKTSNILSLLFFSKLNSLFSKDVIGVNKKEKTILSVESTKKIQREIISLYVPDGIKTSYDRYYEITEKTNCLDGNFHNWIVDKCKNCGMILDSPVNIKKNKKEIKANYLYKSIKEYIEKKNIIPTDDEIHKYINLFKKKTILENDKRLLDTKKNEKSMNILNELLGKFNKYNADEYFNLFTERIYKFIGKDIDNIHIVKNLYVINHDKFGNILKNIIKTNKVNIGYDDEIKLTIIKIIVGNTEMYYSADTLFYLGHKDNHKKYIENKIQNIHLICIHSILNMLRNFGYSFNSILNYFDGDKNENGINECDLKDIFDVEIKMRFNNIKKSLYYIKQNIYKIANNMIDKEDILYEIIKKYDNLIGNTSYIQKSFLKNMDILFDVIIDVDELKTIYGKNFEENNRGLYQQINNINKYDKLNNFLMYYFVEEICNMIDSVKSTYKTQIIHFFIDLIKYYYFKHNIFLQIETDELRKFYNSMRFYYYDKENENKKIMNNEIDGEITYGMYDEIVDEDNEKNIMNENEEVTNEEEAIDYGTEENFESMYNIIN